MATVEYGRLIKEEVESVPDENNINYSEEKYDAQHNELTILKIKLESEQIKSEDAVYHLKSEKCEEKLKEHSHCELCGRSLLSQIDFFSPHSLKYCPDCQGLNESNAMQSEVKTLDVKPLNLGSDFGIFPSGTQEKTVVGKEENVINRNMSPTPYDKEFVTESINFFEDDMPQKTEEVNEIFISEYYWNSMGENGVNEKNEICVKNFNERSDTENRPTKKILYDCKICTKSFSRSYDLKRHENLHTGEKTFRCGICSKSFLRKYDLKNHEKIHTGEKPFSCEICSKSFIQKCYLRSHEKLHTGEKPFQCKICTKSFLRKYDLKNHEKIHTGEKLFQCEICSKSFIQKYNLKTHEKIHTGEKPFQCKICSKSFIHKCHLKDHEKIHTDDKSYQCKICSKLLTRNHDLKRHEKIHTGEKSFKCKICSKSFNQKIHLKRHEKIHTVEKIISV
ncbi:uncharacterized protein [Leptinotarsa decemlineata]|uniref:uncharacterized protein n=1 Tax=Leptinotarsa decemlineata TaxID=7539 RepID=UPI003D30BAF4